MNIVLAGSVAYDYLMKFPGVFTDHILPDKLDVLSLSFLVESMVRQRGGIAPNIAYNLALLGGKSSLFATVGEDFLEYETWLNSKGIDTGLVRKISGVNTASFFANTDRKNNQIASFYPGAMGFASELSFYDMEGKHPDLVIISPTDPVAMRKYAQECQDLFIPYIYDPSQQIVRLSAEDIRHGIVGAKAVFVNEYEYSMIEKMTGMDIDEIMQHVEFLVITLGEKGARIHAAENTWDIDIFPPGKISDPTGVGDAFRGGFLAGLSQDWPLDLCGKLGALSATYCLESDGPQGQAYTTEQYIERFREQFDDGGMLDNFDLSITHQMP